MLERFACRADGAEDMAEDSKRAVTLVDSSYQPGAAASNGIALSVGIS